MKAAYLLPALLLALPLSLFAREFQSADGSKTMEADFVRYDVQRGTVTLRLATGKNIVAATTAFSEEDQKYFAEAQLEKDKANALAIETKMTTADREKVEKGQMEFTYKTSEAVFTLSNRGESRIEGLQVRSFLIVEWDKKGNEQIQVIKNTTKLDPLEARAEQEVKGPNVKLTMGARSTCGCPLVAEAAAKIGRDKIVGTKVELLDADGNVLCSDTSSMRVDDLLAEHASS